MRAFKFRFRTPRPNIPGLRVTLDLHFAIQIHISYLFREKSRWLLKCCLEFKKNSTVRKMALSYLGDELNLQICKFVLELCFDCWNFFKGMLKCKWMFIIFSTCLLKQWKSFLFLILDLKYVALTFKVDPLLLQCWKKWHGAFSPALWAERWHLLQWLLKVVWQC